MFDFLKDPDMVPIILGAASFFVVLAFMFGLTEDRSAERRLKMLETRRNDLRSAMGKDRGKDAAAVAKSVVERLKLIQGDTQKGTAVELMQAGFRSREAIYLFTFVRLAAPILGWALGFFLFFVMHVMETTASNLWMASLAVGIVFGLLPSVLLRNLKSRRMNAMTKSLPDALDLFVICAEAGLSLDATFERVATEVADAHPDIADEFGLTAVELGFMPERARALQALVERCPLQGVRSLVSTLIQTERYGTPLAVAMRVLSAELRNERMMKAEEKAARLPAIMTVPMILFILPALLIVLMGPASLRISDAFK